MILLRLVLLAVLCSGVWCSAAMTADAQTPITVELHVPPDSGLRERVIGQVSDLAVVIVTDAEADASVTVSVERAGVLAWRITIHDHAHDRTETREIAVDAEQPFAQSALDEAAALVARVMLQSLLRDATAEVPAVTTPPSTTTSPSEAPALATADNAPVAPAIVAAPTEPTATPESSSDVNDSLRMWLGAGAQLALADRDLKLWPSVDLWIGVKQGALTLGVQVGYGVDATAHGTAADIAIARHALLAMARMNAVDADWGALGAWVQLGAHVFVRQTERVADGWQALPAHTAWTPAAGLGGQWLLALWKGGSLGFSLGAHVQLARPVVRVMASAGGSSTLLRGMLIAPVSWLSLEMLL